MIVSHTSINGLMRHLRNNGISINGSTQKRQLRNEGYFHGYKGYRFFRYPEHKINYTSYSEIHSTIEYDSKLKTLLYGKMMSIETALKSVVTECIIDYDDSEEISNMLKLAISSYQNCPPSSTEREKNTLQKQKLNIESIIRKQLQNNYKHRRINHYYKNSHYEDVPVWALIDVMMLGEFGTLVEGLTMDVRDRISKELDISNHYDQQRHFIYDSIFTLKDLRNSIAHNSIIFDASFKNYSITPCVNNTLRNEIGLVFINFDSLDDYIILMSYMLKKLETPKREIITFINDYLKIVEWYENTVDSQISSAVIRNDCKTRMNQLINYVKSN